MLLRAYARELAAAVQEAGFQAGVIFSFEERAPHLGLVKGILTFLDGSELHFSEFLAATEDGVHKIKYRYHCAHGPSLRFRYDNGRDPKARSLSTYPHHKHTPAEIIPADPPSLIQAIREAESLVAIP